MTAAGFFPAFRRFTNCTCIGSLPLIYLKYYGGRALVDGPRHTWNLLQYRQYWNKRAPRAPPTKPLSFDYSGDLTTNISKGIDVNQPKLGFEGLPDYDSADEVIKKIVSLNFSTQGDLVNKVIHDLVNKVKDHPLDINSLEIMIAKETVQIRNKIEHCLQFRHDKVAKATLIERIHHRNKTLNQLRRRDIEKFNWLTSELQLQLPPDPRHVPKKLSKREQREQAARQASAAIINRKNEELKKRLAAEKVVFDEYRERELVDIQQSLKELGLGEMISFEHTMEALGASDLIPKPASKESRRRRKLAMKFALYGEEKKRKDAEILQAHGFIVPKSLLTASS